MSIFSRFSTMIRANINDLISRNENPEKMLDQIVLDMRDQLTKAKRDVAAAIADERKLKKQVETKRKEVDRWRGYAVKAVRENRDDLARQALAREEEENEALTVLQQAWEAQHDETGKLKAALRQLNEKIEEAKRKKNLLKAKQKRAEAQKRIHDTMSGLSTTSAFEAFNRMADKIEAQEQQNLAEAEVSEALTGDTLEQEFLRLDAGSADEALDDKLLELKAKMGMLPAGESEAPRQLGAGSVTPARAPVRDAELIDEFERMDRKGG